MDAGDVTVEGAAAPIHQDACDREHPGGTVSAARLALFFSWPSLTGEFRPASPWDGDPTPVSRQYTPRPDADADQAEAEFTASLRRGIGNARHVAVLYSGGLDSSAVLWHTLQLGRERDLAVTPVLVNAMGDDGLTSLEYARISLAALRLDLEPVVVDLPSDAEAARDDVAEWSPQRPSPAAMPGTLQRALDRAADLGAEVLLTGDGSDELLGVPRFMSGTLLRHARGVRRYLLDCWEATGSFALAMEALAVGSRLLPRSASMRLFLAACSPEVCDPRPSRALAPRWRPLVERWSRIWLGDLLAHYAARHRTWATADIYDSFFPWEGAENEAIASPIPYYTPFLTDEFIEYALGIPPHQRFDVNRPSAYMRRKAIVSGLLPEHARGGFPKAKQTYRQVQHHQFRISMVDPVLGRQIGLIDPDLDLGTLSPTETHRVAAMERWLRGAVESGAHIDDTLREPPAPPPPV